MRATGGMSIIPVDDKAQQQQEQGQFEEQEEEEENCTQWCHLFT